MLKFLDNPQANREKPRPLLNYKPAIVYGNSAESPREFQNAHTIIAPQTHVNPYLTFEPERIKNIPAEKLNQVSPAWIKKVDPHSLQELNFSTQVQNRHKEDIKETNIKFGTSQFHMTRGEFTDFLDRNRYNHDLAPIHGDERTHERINMSKSFAFSKGSSINNSTNLWNRGKQLGLLSANISSNSEIITNYSRPQVKQLTKQIRLSRGSVPSHPNLSGMTSDNSVFYSSFRSGSISGIPIRKSIEKERIRENRQKSHTNFANQLQNRKKQRIRGFQLPQLAPGQELFFKFKSNSKNQPSSQKKTDDLNEQIEAYESQMHKRFK